MRRMLHLVPLALLALATAGCGLVGDLLELAFWTLALAFIVLLAVLWWGARKVRALFGGGPRSGHEPPPPDEPPVV